IPLAYRLFFLYIEPISALVGAFYAGWLPAQYLAYLAYLSSSPSTSTSSPSLSSSPTSSASMPPNVNPDTPTLISLQQLANLYLLFAINEHCVLSSTNSLRTWRTLLAGLLLADFGHLVTMVPMARSLGEGAGAGGGGGWWGWWEVFGRFWGWDAMLWGSVGFVYVGASMRMAFLLGVGLG
ncbi:hypothetical protein L226DRAFT_447385, partial [Lentinus tigrinus ALCF2SS1-7]